MANEHNYDRLELTTLTDLVPAMYDIHCYNTCIYIRSCFYKSKGYQKAKSEEIGLGCELVHMSKLLKCAI